MERTILDRLRDEYFDLLPTIRRVLNRLETEIRFHTLAIQQRLKSHEQLIVKSRIKECESAVDTVRRKGNHGKGEGKVFDPERPEDYSMLNLPDLAGVRVLVFPDSRLIEVDETLRNHFVHWRYDPVPNSENAPIAHKYIGKLDFAKSQILSEYQVVPMLLGLYWEVEHSARYKSVLKQSQRMSDLSAKVETALSEFEAGIASLLPDNSASDS